MLLKRLKQIYALLCPFMDSKYSGSATVSHYRASWVTHLGVTTVSWNRYCAFQMIKIHHSSPLSVYKCKILLRHKLIISAIFCMHNFHLEMTSRCKCIYSYGQDPAETWEDTGSCSTTSQLGKSLCWLQGEITWSHIRNYPLWQLGTGVKFFLGSWPSEGRRQGLSCSSGHTKNHSLRYPGILKSNTKWMGAFRHVLDRQQLSKGFQNCSSGF